jgi:Arc/MetJ-type ribon-helix-helix transcriptional regulator
MTSEPSRLARLSMSLPADLFRQLDVMVEERGLPSRSQLIAELIRHALAEHEALTRLRRRRRAGSPAAGGNPDRLPEGSDLLAARLP